MTLKPKLEAIIYAAEEPVTLNELASLLKDEVLAELRAHEDARLALNQTISDAAIRDEDGDDTGLTPPLEEQFFAEDDASAETGPAPSSTAPPPKSAPAKGHKQPEDKEQLKAIKACLDSILDELIADYASPNRGMEIRQVAGGYRMATKPEHHDVVVRFAKSLTPPVRLSSPALETLAVIAYKQPVTVPEISEIRGVDSAGVIATLLDRKLITTAGRKQVIGRPILYKTSKEFLLRFGLNDVTELPSMEEFEKLGDPQSDLFPPSSATSPTPATTSTGPITEAAPELLASSNSNAAAPISETAAHSPEPVTEAVPELASNQNRVGAESVLPAEGTFATEALPGETPEK
jgi:segregation and condensation protein B